MHYSLSSAFKQDLLTMTGSIAGADSAKRGRKSDSMVMRPRHLALPSRKVLPLGNFTTAKRDEPQTREAEVTCTVLWQV